MSFSNRLTTFFVLMVLIPIVGIGVLGFRLISQTTSGRAGARASGLATAATELYTTDEEQARQAAQAVAEAIGGLPTGEVKSRISQAAASAGLERVVVRRNGKTIADVGNGYAVAPGTIEVRSGKTITEVVASVTTASQFVQAVSGPLSAALLTQDGRALASSLTAKAPDAPPPAHITIAGIGYQTDTDRELTGFNGQPVALTMLSDVRASSGSDADSDLLAVAFLCGLALLAFGFAVLASRGLNEMVKRFLAAATRLADRDFSVRVPVEGKDEFAKLAIEFNNMSDQLRHYIAELDEERERLRDAIRRTGESFASSRDKAQLEAITLSTAVAGIEADFGRMTLREDENAKLAVVQASGPWSEAGQLILQAEQIALNEEPFGEAHEGDLHVMAARMGLTPNKQLAYGTLAVGRRGEPFSDDDKNLFRSLAVQAWQALDNVRLHEEAERKAVTDLLTGLANHGQFQAVLNHEMEDVRRYSYPISLILLDLDNFKRVNDTYGHQQGDAVLRSVADVLIRSTREGDTAARYGGEEMALILPHTDLEGAYAIADRIRSEIAETAVSMVDGDGELNVTASIGVSATTGGEKVDLIADADAALYEAKRSGKNRVVRSATVRSS